MRASSDQLRGLWIDPETDADRRDVARVLAGDPVAFEGIVRRWQGPLVLAGPPVLPAPGASRGAGQEAFVRAFRSLARWRGDAMFSTWLFAIAVNVCRTDLRRYRPVEVQLEDVQLRAKDAVGEESAARERDEVVRRMVATLPARYREVVVLYYFCETDVTRAAGRARRSDRDVQGEAAPGPGAAAGPAFAYHAMKMDFDDVTIERALSTDRSPSPSSRLVIRVMQDVRSDLEGPLPFPWVRLVCGLGLAGLVLVVALLAAPPAPPVSTPAGVTLLPPFVMQRLAEGLAGCVLLFWWTRRVAGGV